MFNMNLFRRIIEETHQGGPILPPSPHLVALGVPGSKELDWLNASEATVEALLADRQVSPSKSPRFARYDDRIDGPVSTEFWSDESGRVATSRKISNVRSSKVIGFTHSFSMAAALPGESTLEAEAERLFDWAPSTVSVHPQPPRIAYALDGASHFTTPDLLVVAVSDRYLVEVKPLQNALDPLAIRRFEAIQQGAAAQQLKYCVATERVLCAEPRRSNIMKMRRHALHPVDRRDATWILSFVPDAPGSTSIGELRSRLDVDADRLMPTVGSMIFWHLVRTDLTRVLDSETRLWKRPEVSNV